MKRVISFEWAEDDTKPLAFVGGLRDQAKKWFEDNGYSATVLDEEAS